MYICWNNIYNLIKVAPDTNLGYGIMKTTDVIIETYLNVPKDKDREISYVGWDCQNPVLAFHNYADSYRYAADIVYREFTQKTTSLSDLDRLGYTICYLYRQSIELSLKFVFMCTNPSKEEGQIFIKKSHNLLSLWKSLKPLIGIYANKECDAIEHYISEFHNFDKTSMLMRYPVDNTLRPNKTDMKINIKIFAQAAQTLQDKLFEIGYNLKQSTEG